MSTNIERRNFIMNSAIIAGTTAAAAAVPGRIYAEIQTAATPITYEVMPLPIDPAKVQGISEKLLVSHHDNNYAGAVKRLNAITVQLANLDWATAPTFLVNGLKREELIATNSMILH